MEGLCTGTKSYVHVTETNFIPFSKGFLTTFSSTNDPQEIIGTTNIEDPQKGPDW